MGTSRTPAYRMELAVDNGRVTPFGWDVGGKYGKGKANAENLKKYVEAFEASTQPGGCNSHLGVTRVLTAQIVKQSTGDTVATYKA